jgi:superoxide dismutase, Fe-Mn family
MSKNTKQQDSETLRELITLIESQEKGRLKQTKLPYSKSALSPVMSSKTIDYHYGELYKGYVDRYNKGEGDKAFNEAGAFLHDIYFTQFKRPGTGQPSGYAKEFITKKFGTFGKFKEQFTKTAMGIQGSGWVYLAKNGEIKVIRNHAVRRDIALLVDWWEHAWSLDYQADKAKYLNNIWKIIDWTVISGRL